MNHVSPTAAAKLLRAALSSPQRLPVLLLTGQPGIGKSAVPRQAVEWLTANTERSWTLYDITGPVVEPYEPGGITTLPGPGEDRARKLPVGELANAILDHDENNPALVHLEDLGQASEDVQKAMMRLIHTDDTHLPPHVHLVASTNRRSDRAGVKGLLSPVQNRVIEIPVRPPTPDEWVMDWALPHGMPASIMAYHRWGAVANREAIVSASLCSLPPAEGGPYPTPRSWAGLGYFENAATDPHVVHAGGISDDLLHLVACGAVGEGEAAGYAAFRSLFADAVFADEVFLDPQNARLPDHSKPALAAGLVAGLIHRLDQQPTPGACNAVATYLSRMAGNGWHEYAAFGLVVCAKSPNARAPFNMCAAANALRCNPSIQAIAMGSDHR